MSDSGSPVAVVSATTGKQQRERALEVGKPSAVGSVVDVALVHNAEAGSGSKVRRRFFSAFSGLANYFGHKKPLVIVEAKHVEPPPSVAPYQGLVSYVTPPRWLDRWLEAVNKATLFTVVDQSLDGLVISYSVLKLILIASAVGATAGTLKTVYPILLASVFASPVFLPVILCFTLVTIGLAIFSNLKSDSTNKATETWQAWTGYYWSTWRTAAKAMKNALKGTENLSLCLILSGLSSQLMMVSMGMPFAGLAIVQRLYRQSQAALFKKRLDKLGNAQKLLSLVYEYDRQALDEKIINATTVEQNAPQTGIANPITHDHAGTDQQPPAKELKPVLEGLVEQKHITPLSHIKIKVRLDPCQGLISIAELSKNVHRHGFLLSGKAAKLEGIVEIHLAILDALATHIPEIPKQSWWWHAVKSYCPDWLDGTPKLSIADEQMRALLETQRTKAEEIKAKLNTANAISRRQYRDVLTELHQQIAKMQPEWLLPDTKVHSWTDWWKKNIKGDHIQFEKSREYWRWLEPCLDATINGPYTICCLATLGISASIAIAAAPPMIIAFIAFIISKLAVEHTAKQRRDIAVAKTGFIALKLAISDSHNLSTERSDELAATFAQVCNDLIALQRPSYTNAIFKGTSVGCYAYSAITSCFFLIALILTLAGISFPPSLTLIVAISSVLVIATFVAYKVAQVKNRQGAFDEGKNMFLQGAVFEELKKSQTTDNVSLALLEGYNDLEKDSDDITQWLLEIARVVCYSGRKAERISDFVRGLFSLSCDDGSPAMLSIFTIITVFYAACQIISTYCDDKPKALKDATSQKSTEPPSEKVEADKPETFAKKLTRWCGPSFFAQSSPLAMGDFDERDNPADRPPSLVAGGSDTRVFDEEKSMLKSCMISP